MSVLYGFVASSSALSGLAFYVWKYERAERFSVLARYERAQKQARSNLCYWGALGTTGEWLGSLCWGAPTVFSGFIFSVVTHLIRSLNSGECCHLLSL